MNINETATKCYSVLNPNLNTVRYANDIPGDTTISTLVRTAASEGDKGYITLSDMVTLGQAGLIEIVDVRTEGLAADYGRTHVDYRIMCPRPTA